MATYHFLKNSGDVLECFASNSKSCGIAGPDEHYTSFEAATLAMNEAIRQERNKLDPSRLAHGDRITLRNPHNGFLLDSVVNDTGYNLLIQTTGADASTNDVKSLIAEGWLLKRRVGAYGEMAESAGAAELRANNRANELFRELRTVENKLEQLEEVLSKDPSDVMVKRHVESFRDQVKHLTATHAAAQNAYAEAVLLAVGGDRPPHFTGLQDIPYGFRGINGFYPSYLFKETGDEIIERAEGYDYVPAAGEDKWFESFGEAVEWARLVGESQKNS